MRLRQRSTALQPGCVILVKGEGNMPRSLDEIRQFSPNRFFLALRLDIVEITSLFQSCRQHSALLVARYSPPTQHFEAGIKFNLQPTVANIVQ